MLSVKKLYIEGFYLMKVGLVLIWVVFSLVWSVDVLALASDRDQPIELEADTADIDDLKGISIYTGNVVLVQGSMVIKAHKLTLYNDKNKELEKAVAEGTKGKLATFKQRPEGKDKDFRARASTMIYYLETVVAKSKKDKHGQPIKSGGRVKVTIQPKSKNK